jgi:hypothetical protein
MMCTIGSAPEIARVRSEAVVELYLHIPEWGKREIYFMIHSNIVRRAMS